MRPRPASPPPQLKLLAEQMLDVATLKEMLANIYGPPPTARCFKVFGRERSAIIYPAC